jgi:hypothetical protein
MPPTRVPNKRGEAQDDKRREQPPYEHENRHHHPIHRGPLGRQLSR